MKHCTLFETQKVFRTLMNSMSLPGKIFTLENIELNPSLIYMICDTLFDHEVTFSVIGEKAEESLINDIAFLTGAQYVDVAEAEYVIIRGGSGKALQNLNIGTLEYPEKGATVIYMVDNLTVVEPARIQLSGPGIKEPFITNVADVRTEEFELLGKINSEFPLGIDIVFCDDKRIMSIPRTTSIAVLQKG